MRIITILICLMTFTLGHSQTTGNPNTGDAYLLFGPNSSWGQYLKIGGNGRGTTHASVVASNGNLHLDSRDGSYSTYINHYSQGNTLINPQGGLVGIGTSTPGKPLHITSAIEHHQLRLEGTNDKHAWMQFYPSGSGVQNWQIGANGNGFSIYDLVNSSYKFTVSNSGKVGIGTQTPSQTLEVNGTAKVGNGDWGALIIDGKNENDWLFNAHNSGTLLGIRTQLDGQSSWSHQVLTLERLSGNVGIGTTVPDSKLTVKGDIHAEEVKVDLSVPGPDYVFSADYDLKSLEEVQNYIKTNGHLPNIPSATEMEENGIQLGEMNMKLLEKIEELTLYNIQLLKQFKKLSLQNKEQQRQIEKILNKLK